MAKRRLRSDTVAEQDAAAATSNQAAPREKKYYCTSCATERVASAFPDVNPSSDCDHLIHTCKTCLKKWVQSRVESSSFEKGGEDGKTFGVRCPQCPAIMRNSNVQMAATKTVYALFEERERHHIAETTPGWRWCLQPNCKAGQVHENKHNAVTDHVVESEDLNKTTTVETEDVPVSRATRKTKVRTKKKTVAAKADVKEESEPEPIEDICICVECGAKACVNCERPWHEGESCKEYQTRTKDRYEEEDLSMREIEKVTRKCPKCAKSIQKNGGCPSMHCTSCNTPFCWNCMTAFKNSYYCECRPPPPPPPPAAALTSPQPPEGPVQLRPIENFRAPAFRGQR